MPPDRPNLSEMTVTCHQCGSASMERLDRKEYRCTHCGAITIISDDDADRVEQLLKEALSRPVPVQTASRSVPPKTIVVAVVAGFLSVLAATLVLSILLDHGGSHYQASSDVPTDRDRTVPVEDVALSELHWHQDSKTYDGMIYNHSGFAIDVPSYEMTLFVNGMKGSSSTSDVVLRRLLPGEYEPISFRFLSAEPGARYEIEKPARIDRNTDAVAPMELTEQQFVQQDGRSEYRLIGLVQNGFTRPVDSTRIVATLYGADHQVLGTGSAYVPALRPGEKAAAEVAIYPYGNAGPVAAYDYLVDASFADRVR